MGSQVGLLEVLRWTVDFSCRTSVPMPLCVDENLHYRLLKFAFGMRTTNYNFHSLLRTCPPLYRVWHAYKYTLTQVHHTHSSILTHLSRGTLTEGTQVPTALPIHSLELLYATLLQLPQAERDAVRRRLVLLQWRFAVVGSH